ncbi:MAG: hypothetical protein ABEN55_04985 [Bradymonadaceae bacterium]
MIHLQPDSRDVVKISLISYGHQDGEDKIERRVTLGYFVESVEDHDFKEAIESHDAASSLLGTWSLQEGQAQITRIPTTLQEGVIFENAEECIKLRKRGITYKDIEQGASLVPESAGSAEEVEDALSGPEWEQGESLESYMQRIQEHINQKETN